MRLRAIVTEVRRSMKGPQIIVSRSHRQLVEALFRLEVPEIADGTVLIKAIARARPATARSSPWSPANPPSTRVGACVGARGSRVRAIVEALNNEKMTSSPGPTRQAVSWPTRSPRRR